MTIKFIKPSGDTTGETDADEICGQIETWRTADTLGTIVVDGTYYFDRQIQIGHRTDYTVVPCNIVGANYGVFNYVGSPLTIEGESTAHDYFLRVNGAETGARNRLANLRIQIPSGQLTTSKCRGLLINRQTYLQAIDNIWIHNFAQMGFDVVDCWGGSFRNIQISYIRGMGMRVNTCNACVFDNVNLRNVWGIWHSATANNEALWEYEMEHGREAAMVEYGLAYSEDWPSPAEEVVWGYRSTGDTWIQTPEAELALIHLYTRHCTFRNIIIENCASGERPIFYMPSYTQNVSCERLYLENNYAGDSKVRVAASSLSSGGTMNIRFVDVLSADKQSALTCESFIRTTGYTSGISVDTLRGEDFGSAIIMCDAGTHYTDGVVRGIKTRDNTIASANWVSAKNGGTISAALPVGVTHSGNIEA